MKLQIRDVSRDFVTGEGEVVHALEGVSLEVGERECVCILGPSGCGKTTALRCLTGTNHPDEGRILLDSKDVTDVPTHQRELGMVFQNFALFPHMTVADNVGFPLMIRNLPREERTKQVIEALRLVRLEGYVDHYPRQLSGGQQQRVGLARALVYRPKVLLLDEPLSNLDAKLREEMRFEIKEVVTRLGITAMYVTHDQGEALALSDRVAIMNRGRLEQLGSPEEIYERPRSRFVAEFIGLSNFLDGYVQAVRPPDMIVMAHGLQVSTPVLDGAGLGQKVLLFLRPNEIDILPANTVLETNLFDARVDKATYLGDTMDYRLTLGDGADLRVQSDARHRYQNGDAVRLRMRRVRSWTVKD